MKDDGNRVEQAREASLRKLRWDRSLISTELVPVFDWIEEHVFDIEVSGRDLRSLLKSKRLQAAFSTEVERGIESYFTGIRLIGGLDLIVNTGMNFSLISEVIGFSEPSDLTKGCLRRYGASPSELRENYQSRALLDRQSDLGAREKERLARRVAADLADWLALSPRESACLLRRGAIQSGHEALFEELISRARKGLEEDRQNGLELMRLPLALIEGSTALLDENLSSLRVRAHAWLANAYRLTGDFEAAEAEMTSSEEYWLSSSGEPRLEGELALFWGSLRVSQRRFWESRRLLSKAIEIAKENLDQATEIQSRLQRAAVSVYEGKPQSAIPDLETVCDRLIGSKEPGSRRGLLDVIHDLVVVYVDSGHIEQAKASLGEAERLTEEENYLPGRNKLSWYRGLIFLAERDFEAAEEELQKARSGFLRLADPLLTALVSLDLAVFYFHQDRHSQTISFLETDVLPIFQGLQLDSEELAAQQVLRQAVARGVVSKDVLDRGRKMLHRLGANPIFS